MSDPVKSKYNSHKSQSKARGIPFELTFEEWLSIWGDKLDKRGRHKDEFGMLRTRDEGGYTLGNVRIGTPKENSQEAAVAYRVKKAQAPVVSLAFRVTAPSKGAWLWRNNVFKEYTEDEEEFS